jgi:hypothetical protein
LIVPVNLVATQIWLKGKCLPLHSSAEGLNNRQFLTGPDVGKIGASVLRNKPNIKWRKDRDKDVESAPWHPPVQM